MILGYLARGTAHCGTARISVDGEMLYEPHNFVLSSSSDTVTV